MNASYTYFYTTIGENSIQQIQSIKFHLPISLPVVRDLPAIRVING